MLYKPDKGGNIDCCAVVLKDAAAAALAHEVLNGSALFTNRVVVVSPGLTEPLEFLSRPRLFWG